MITVKYIIKNTHPTPLAAIGPVSGGNCPPENISTTNTYTQSDIFIIYKRGAGINFLHFGIASVAILEFVYFL